MAIQAVLFDLDGTLVDSNDFHVMAWDEAFRSARMNFGADVIHAQIGKGSDMLLPSLAPDLSDPEQERIGDAHGEAYQGKYLERVKPFPGARELLMRVQQAGKQVVLASSAAQMELDHYLDLLDARTLVAHTTSGDDVERTKPAPDIFAAALAKVAPLTPDEVIVVGDTPYDIEAAAKCGIRTVALRSGKFSDEVLREAGPVALYDDAAELLAQFDSSPLAG
jgi:HAD superfamily hydrolase (TIGR01509 family)